MKPLLTICIPTYNRSAFLKKTLNSIVNQKIFTDTENIEIVVSDNCSTDDTFYVVQKLINRYGEKIKYFKTEKNIGFDNFEYVMNKGTGLFLKLNNDTLAHSDGSLLFMTDVIKKYIDKKPILFFTNKEQKNTEIECTSLDNFILEVSYFNTWIASFGMWNADIRSKKNWFRYNNSQIPQTDILCRMFTGGKYAIVANRKLFNSMEVKNKGGYNIAEVFGYNYLKILKEYVNHNTLSKIVYNQEKKKILTKHINFFYFDIKNRYSFQKTGYFKWLLSDYKYCPYFYYSLFKVFLKILWRKITFELFKPCISNIINRCFILV